MNNLGCMALDFSDGPIGRLAPRADMDLCDLQFYFSQDMLLLEPINAVLQLVEVVASTSFCQQDPGAGLLR